jgi:Tfp pilus assembly protein PilF
MKPACRRGFLRAALVAFVLLSGACTQPSGEAAPEVSTQTEPQQPISYLSRGKYLLTAREPDLAMNAFLTSMSVDGISVAALTGAGIAAQQRGLLISAQRYFEQARDLDPNSVAANNNLGVVLYMRKEYYPAQSAFQTAYALSSGTSETAERNLNRAEATIAQIEGLAETDLAIARDGGLFGSGEFEFTED